MTTRILRRAFLATALAGALALGTVVPANALSADPIGDQYGGTNLGIVHLFNEGGGVRKGLQATNETYYAHGDARNVAVTQNDIDQPKWYLIKLDNGYYKFINVATGMALQKTNESRAVGPWANEVVTTPASWNNEYQQWDVVPRWGETGHVVYIYNRATTSNGYYNDMLRATTLPYNGNSQNSQVDVGRDVPTDYRLQEWIIPEVTFVD